MEFINNPHCGKPFLAKDGTNWYIQFWYNHEGNRLSKKEAFNLNSSRFRVKSNGKTIEINKNERKAFVSRYLTEVSNLLETQYFNPVTKKYELIDEADKSFIYFIEYYINNSKLEESSKKTYKSYFICFKDYLTANNLLAITLNEISKELITKYLSQYKMPSHRNGNLRFLKAVINYCVEELEIIEQNPLKKVKYQKVPDSDSNKVYSNDEFEKLLQVSKSISNEFYILLLIIYYTLRRPTEILKLKYQDFDFKNCTIYFSGKIAKTDKRQIAHIPEFFMQFLLQYIPEKVKDEYYFLGSTKDLNGRHKLQLFDADKTPLTYFQDKFKTKAIQQIVKDGQTIYSVKHTGVIYLKEKGHSNQEIMGTTGHKDEASLGIYAREYKPQLIKRTDNLLV